MSRNDGYSGAHLMLAFIAGAVGGAAVALLTAPQPGGETRETLRGWAGDAQGQATRIPHALQQAYRRASVAAKEAFTEALRDAPAETEPTREG